MSRIMPSLSDGRCFTNYLSSCQYDIELQKQFKQSSESSYRIFLQQNALKAQTETRKLHVCTYPFMDAAPTSPTVAPSNSF